MIHAPQNSLNGPLIKKIQVKLFIKEINKIVIVLFWFYHYYAVLSYLFLCL